MAVGDFKNVNKRIANIAQSVEDYIHSEKKSSLKREIEITKTLERQYAEKAKAIESEMNRFILEYSAKAEDESSDEIYRANINLNDILLEAFKELTEEQAQEQLDMRISMASQTVDIYNDLYGRSMESHRQLLQNILADEHLTADQLAKSWGTLYGEDREVSKSEFIDRLNANILSQKEAEQVVTEEETPTAPQQIQIITDSEEKDRNEKANLAENLREAGATPKQAAEVVQKEENSDNVDQTRDQINKELKNLNSEKKNTTASLVAATAGEALISVIKKVIDLVLDGILGAVDTIVADYNKNAEAFAIYTNKSINELYATNEYHKAEQDIIAKLREDNLDEEISAVDVMTNVNKLLAEGYDYDTAMKLAYQNTVDDILAPMVKHDSAVYLQLSDLFGNDFTDSINGIAEAMSDINDNHNIFNKNIDSVIEKLGPVSLYATEELYSVESFSKVQALYDAGYITEAQGSTMIQQATTAAENPYNALSSSNVAIRTAAMNGATTIDEFLDAIIQYGVYSGNSNGLAQGSVLSMYGLSDMFSYNADMNKIAELWNTTEENVQQYVEDDSKTEDAYTYQLNRLKAGLDTTVENMEDNIAANSTLANYIATWEEEYPFIDEAIKDIVKLLKSIVDLVKVFSSSGWLTALGEAGGQGILGILSKITGVSAGQLGAFAALLATIGTVAVGTGKYVVEAFKGIDAQIEAQKKAKDEGRTLTEEEEQEVFDENVSDFTSDVNRYATDKYTSGYYGLSGFAEGGFFTNIVQNATVGEDGKEVVLPLENNTEWANTLASKIDDNAYSVIDYQSTEEYEIETEEMNDNLIKVIKDSQDRISKAIKNNATEDTVSSKTYEQKNIYRSTTRGTYIVK